MLAQKQRVTTADDYRSAVRRGARYSAPNLVVYARRIAEADSGNASLHTARYGFIVSKKVGNAVARNQVRRRLKAICYELQREVCPGVDVVVRALPPAATAPFTELRRDVRGAFAKASLFVHPVAVAQ